MSVEQAAAPESDPVLDALTAEIRASLGDAVLDVSESWGQLMLRVPAERRADALAVLKTLGFDYYSWAGGVDWPDEDKFEVLDNVCNTKTRARVTVRCDVPRSQPRVPTAITVFRGADWHERETWELFGIVFVGHPQLRRLLLADWQEGFPMRKDEVLRARVEKPWPGEFFSG